MKRMLPVLAIGAALVGYVAGYACLIEQRVDLGQEIFLLVFERTNLHFDGLPGIAAIELHAAGR